MRTIVLLTVASAMSLAAVAACEVVLPFDRSLIPPEAGLVDGTVSGGEDAPTAEESSTEDALAPPGDAGEAGDADAAVEHDASAEAGSAGDGGADAMPAADSSPDADVGDANDAAGGG